MCVKKRPETGVVRPVMLAEQNEHHIRVSFWSLKAHCLAHPIKLRDVGGDEALHMADGRIGDCDGEDDEGE